MKAYKTKECTVQELREIYNKLSTAKEAVAELFDMAVIGASRYAMTSSELRYTMTMVDDAILEMEETEAAG